MKIRPEAPSRTLLIGLGSLLLLSTFALRTWGITTRFWLLGDQIRDWNIALGSFRSLPLVGPATHVGGYTIGPAFYWILWIIRVTFGPWFDNLPHAGGIGQAAIQSLADVLLFVAIRHRTQSIWIALTTVVIVATAGYDLALAGLVWNPVMGSTLAKVAIGLMLLNWHRRSLVHILVAVTVAWAAVHAYTGAIFVAVSAFTAMLLDPLIFHDRQTVKRNAIVIVSVVALLQIPYAIQQVSTRFRAAAMGAVTSSVGRVISGQNRPEVEKSRDGYVAAVNFVEVQPWQMPPRRLWWLLLASAGIVAVRYWRDVTLSVTTIMPGALAIAGYAFFLAPLDHYYYLSLMPAAVLSFVLAATAIPIPRVSRAIAITLLALAVVIVPWRYRFSTTLHRMPEYGILLKASREMVKRSQTVRSIQTEFKLPPTADAEFMYRILGGRIDASSPWIVKISPSGSVDYINVQAGG